MEYNDNQFIDALKTGAKLNAGVAQAVGCSESVAKKRLTSLVTTGKVKVQFFANSNFKVYILA